RLFCGIRGQREILRDEELRRITHPALVVWGDRDRFFPPAHGERAAATLPLASIHWVRGAGHSPSWEAPDRVATTLARFLGPEGPTPGGGCGARLPYARAPPGGPAGRQGSGTQPHARPRCYGHEATPRSTGREPSREARPDPRRLQRPPRRRARRRRYPYPRDAAHARVPPRTGGQAHPHLAPGSPPGRVEAGGLAPPGRGPARRADGGAGPVRRGH